MPTLLLCSATDDLRELREAFEAAAAGSFPTLKVSLWPQAFDPPDVVAAAVWFAPAGLLASLPNLRLIASIGAGVEHVLKDPQLPAGTSITRIVNEQQAQGMAEFVLWATLYYHRNLDQVQRQQRQALWRMPVQKSPGQTQVGIMGLGAMGAEVARCLRDHGFTVSGWSRQAHAMQGVRTYAGPEQLGAFLAPQDVVVSLLPLTRETHSLCNAGFFARLKPQAAFINCGRGEQVVLNDLLAALDSGHLRSAVLDVFEHEPLPATNPLWQHPRVLVTPHMASAASSAVIARQIVGNASRVQAGLPPLHAINRQQGY